MQYFYIVAHAEVGDDLVMDKVFLTKEQAVSWGRRQAENHQRLWYGLYRQPMTRTGKVTFCKALKSLPYTPVDHLTEAVRRCERSLKTVQAGGFDWDTFNMLHNQSL